MCLPEPAALMASESSEERIGEQMADGCLMPHRRCTPFQGMSTIRQGCGYPSLVEPVRNLLRRPRLLDIGDEDRFDHRSRFRIDSVLPTQPTVRPEARRSAVTPRARRSQMIASAEASPARRDETSHTTNRSNSPLWALCCIAANCGRSTPERQPEPVSAYVATIVQPRTSMRVLAEGFHTIEGRVDLRATLAPGRPYGESMRDDVRSIVVELGHEIAHGLLGGHCLGDGRGHLVDDRVQRALVDRRTEMGWPNAGARLQVVRLHAMWEENADADTFAAQLVAQRLAV